MNRMKHLLPNITTLKVWLCAVLVTLFSACEDITCPLNNTVAGVYGFYASNRSGDGPFVAGSAISISDTVTIKALGADEVVANRLVNKSKISLPVSFYAECDSLEFTFTAEDGSSAADTVWIYKENYAHLDNPSCPLHMWHTITYVRSTHHLTDSVLINHAEITYDGLENLQIYFRTAE